MKYHRFRHTWSQHQSLKISQSLEHRAGRKKETRSHPLAASIFQECAYEQTCWLLTLIKLNFLNHIFLHAFAVKLKILLYSVQNLKLEILHMLNSLLLKKQHRARQSPKFFFFSFGLKSKFRNSLLFTVKKNPIQLCNYVLITSTYC